MGFKDKTRKERLAKKGRQTRWAPAWVVWRKFGGMGRKIHASRVTRNRRSWKRTKLKVGPRKIKRYHYG